MKNGTFYTQWKQYRRHVPVPENFAASVMARIEEQVPIKTHEVPAGPTDFHNGLMQLSAAAGLVLLGLFRIFYIAVNLIRTNQLMPY